MNNEERVEKLTLEAIENPMEGDLFTEMLSYWLLVQSVDKNGVYLEHQPSNDSCKPYMTFEEYNLSPKITIED